MKNETYFRQQLIDYIVTNDIKFTHTNFDNHSLTTLVIMKVELEVKKMNSVGKKLYIETMLD